MYLFVEESKLLLYSQAGSLLHTNVVLSSTHAEKVLGVVCVLLCHAPLVSAAVGAVVSPLVFML